MGKRIGKIEITIIIRCYERQFKETFLLDENGCEDIPPANRNQIEEISVSLLPQTAEAIVLARASRLPNLVKIEKISERVWEITCSR